MKFMKFAVFAIALLFTACSSNITHSIAIKTSIDEESGQTSIGDSFSLEVTAIDEDGIESVSLEIPALNFSELYQNISGKKWSTQQDFIIDENATRGASLITVIVKDKTGEEKEQSTTLVIE